MTTNKLIIPWIGLFSLLTGCCDSTCADSRALGGIGHTFANGSRNMTINKVVWTDEYLIFECDITVPDFEIHSTECCLVYDGVERFLFPFDLAATNEHNDLQIVYDQEVSFHGAQVFYFTQLINDPTAFRENPYSFINYGVFVTPPDIHSAYFQETAENIIFQTDTL